MKFTGRIVFVTGVLGLSALMYLNAPPDFAQRFQALLNQANYRFWSNKIPHVPRESEMFPLPAKKNQ